MKQIQDNNIKNIYFLIFYYILYHYKKKNIKKYNFQNRSFLIIKKSSEKNLFNLTGNPNTYSFYNNFFKEYNSFISFLISNNCIIIKKNNLKLLKDISKIIKSFKFSNKNKLKKIIKKYSLIPNFLIKFYIKKYFLKKDKELFKSDYCQYYSKNYSRPLDIGTPFLLKKKNQKKGVILVHGYLSAPSEVSKLATLLHDNGYTVYCIRMRGHGTTHKDLAKTSWEDWYYSINRGQMIIQNYVDNFIIIGFSTGAGLALLQCTEKTPDYKAVISINAPLYLRYISSQLSDTIVSWNNMMKNLNVQKIKLEFIKHIPENMKINYMYNPVKGVHELHKAMICLNKKLNQINLPALIIQGKHDPIITSKSGEKIYNQISSKRKKLVIIKTRRHGIIHGEELNLIIKEIISFLKNIFN